MIIPVRCFTCGKVIGNKWETYLSLLQMDISEGDALDELGLKRYCCRRMVLTHVDLIEKLLNYNCECLAVVERIHTNKHLFTDRRAFAEASVRTEVVVQACAMHNARAAQCAPQASTTACHNRALAQVSLTTVLSVQHTSQLPIPAPLLQHWSGGRHRAKRDC
jgi:DNA-directed RNA polymerases I, II, and III subunit RPABC5